MQILRTGNQCLTNRIDAAAKAGEVLLTATHMGGELHTVDQYKIQQDKSGPGLWIVVKSLQGRVPGYQISQGDVLRFGKVPMAVRRISPSGERASIRIREKRTIGKQETSECGETHLLQEMGQCRICLGETAYSENPLISPCNCDGTMKYVHLLCLREWLKSKMSVRESGSVVTYSCTTVACELCKEAFPETIEYQGASISLVDFHLADLAYVVLEDLLNPTEDRLFYVISLYEGASIRIVSLT